MLYAKRQKTAVEMRLLQKQQVIYDFRIVLIIACMKKRVVPDDKKTPFPLVWPCLFGDHCNIHFCLVNLINKVMAQKISFS